MFVTFNSQWPYATATRNGGESWSKPVCLDSTLHGSYFYAGGSVVISSTGAAYFAYVATPNNDEESDATDDYYFRDDDYGLVHGNATTSNYTYARVYASFDYGNSWIGYNISHWVDHQKCPEWAECGSDFFTGSCAIAADVGGNVYYAFNGDDYTTTTSTETRVLLTMKAASSNDVSLSSYLSFCLYFRFTFFVCCLLYYY